MYVTKQQYMSANNENKNQGNLTRREARRRRKLSRRRFRNKSKIMRNRNKSRKNRKRNRKRSRNRRKEQRIFHRGIKRRSSSRTRYPHRHRSPASLKDGFHHHHFIKYSLKDKLCAMNHIIFWDIDNWSRFFERLAFFLPIRTFVWGFHSTNWNYPVRCLPFHGLQSYGGFYKNYQSGNTKNAADFAMMLQIGKMAELLPERVQFIILSGDKGFQEAVHQLKDTRRTIRIINPHIPGWQTTLHNILHQHNGQFLQQGTRPGI